MSAPFSWSFTTAAAPGLSAPSGLTDTVSNATQINLTWTESSSGVTGYLVQRSTTDSNFSTVGTVTSGSTTYYSDVGLSPSTTYYYQVIATSSSATPPPSSVVAPPRRRHSCRAASVAEWAFDDGQGTTTVDSTGDGHTGTLSGSVSWTTSSMQGPYALSFSSTGSGEVVVPDSPSLEFTAAQSFSLTAWVNVPALPQGGSWTAIVSKSRGAGNWYAIFINPSNQWVSSSGPGGSTDVIGSTVTTGWTRLWWSRMERPAHGLCSSTGFRWAAGRLSRPTGRVLSRSAATTGCKATSTGRLTMCGCTTRPSRVLRCKACSPPRRPR